MTETGTEALYFNSLAPSAPPSLRNQLLALPHDTLLTVDTFLRFVLGSACPSTASHDLCSTWNSAQQEVAQRIAHLKQSSSNGNDGRKRVRDDEPSTNSKRSKMSQDAQPTASSVSNTSDLSSDDPPLFTLHALSLTSPIRKKADITIHKHTLRLTHPTTHASEHPPIPLSAIRRAFLLPTRGKSKPHWSVLLMPCDVRPAGGKSSKDKEETPAIAFGVDATPAGFSTTSYGTDGKPRNTAHPKGTAVLSSLRTFLGHLPIATLEPSTDVFRSAFPGAGGSGAEGVAGIEAYRGAKPGTLWFFSEGVLWDGRPAEFFALSDLAKNREGEVEGVRTISATGRTCSVILRRVEAAKDGGGSGEESEDEEDEEARTVDVDFGMVDGKEQEGIARWVKRHRHLFGRRDLPSSQAPAQVTGNGSSGGAGPSTSINAGASNPAEEDESDEEDSDFVDDSSSDGGSVSSDSDSASGDGGAGVEDVSEGEAEGSEDGEEEGGDEEGEGELNPERHPLMRPGAMPRMSHAAMEAVVGMVEEDLLGPMSSGGGGRGRVGAEESDEEDELED